MKRSSPPLQFFAPAATSAEASTRPSYRGARSQMTRRFSDQYSSVGGGRGRILTRDSHFPSASDANQGFRSVERTNYDNQFGYRAQDRLPVYNPQCHFIPPPHWYTTRPIITPYFIPHPQSFNQNQRNRPPRQFGPRPPMPLNYRNWESAKLGPPPPSERFKVLSYNILADYLARNHRSKLYFHIPEKMLDWEWRKKNIIFELGLWSADILCFQEVDKFQDLEEELKLRGYRGIWKMRTGVPVDGCAIFWRVSRFKLLHEECIEFSKLGLRDNVAQICVLESLNQNNNKDMSALPLSLTGSNKVVICNIHVLYNPKRGEIKLGQIRVLLDRAHAVSKLWDDAPVILSGDFNCTPKSPLYNYISEQKLNLSDLPRDKLSGQASAEIRPPKQFSHNIRGQRGSRNDVSSADWTKGTHQEVDGYKDETPDGGLKAQNRVWYWENIYSNFIEKDLTKETHQDTVDGCNNEFHSMVSTSGLNDITHKEGEAEHKKEIASTMKVSTMGSSDSFSSLLPAKDQDNPSNSSQVNVSYELTSMDSMVDEKMEDLPLKEHPETDGADEICAEDSTNFLSELHGRNAYFSSDESCKETEHDKSLNFRYDPSKWTPMEIETATGDADCTLVEHSLKLSSTYTEVEDCSGTRDSNGEPRVTSYNRCFLGTVDYIWRSEGLRTVRVLAPIPNHVMQWTQGFPTKKWGSDHIALVSELAFAKDRSIQNS